MLVMTWCDPLAAGLGRVRPSLSSLTVRFMFGYAAGTPSTPAQKAAAASTPAATEMIQSYGFGDARDGTSRALCRRTTESCSHRLRVPAKSAAVIDSPMDPMIAAETPRA